MKRRRLRPDEKGIETNLPADQGGSTDHGRRLRPDEKGIETGYFGVPLRRRIHPEAPPPR